MAQISESAALAVLERRPPAVGWLPIPPKRIIPGEPSLAQIMWAVGLVTGVEAFRLKGARKADGIARARRLFYATARNLTTKSYPAIGRVCNKDHTTVMHGCRKAAERHSDYKADLDAIEAAIVAIGRGAAG